MRNQSSRTTAAATAAAEAAALKKSSKWRKGLNIQPFVAWRNAVWRPSCKDRRARRCSSKRRKGFQPFVAGRNAV